MNDRCLELDSFDIVLATLYALSEKGVKKVSRKKLHLAVYLSMKKLNYDCLEFT